MEPHFCPGSFPAPDTLKSLIERKLLLDDSRVAIAQYISQTSLAPALYDFTITYHLPAKLAEAQTRLTAATRPIRSAKRRRRQVAGLPSPNGHNDSCSGAVDFLRLTLEPKNLIADVYETIGQVSHQSAKAQWPHLDHQAIGQEAWAFCITRLPDMDAGLSAGELVAFLRRTVRNKGYNFGRSEKRRRARNDAWGFDYWNAKTAAKEATDTLEEKRTQFARQLSEAGYGPDSRVYRVVMARDFEGRDWQDIATQLGLSVAAVRTTYYRSNLRPPQEAAGRRRRRR